MDAVFLKVLNMSTAASWLILAVLLLRPVLRKAPKWTCCVLWALVAVRLICPFSIESALSLIPSAEALPQKVLTGPSYRVDTGVGPVDTVVNEFLEDRYFEGVSVPVHSGSRAMTVLGIVWLIGAAGMAAYGLVSYVRLRREVREAVPIRQPIHGQREVSGQREIPGQREASGQREVFGQREIPGQREASPREHVWVCDAIDTPFILGIGRPRIYLPSDLDESGLSHVLAHEQAHLKRHDHWWKPLGFALLAVYWFNPLVWAAYILLCRDIELACDEKVIRTFSMEEKKAYSDALLSCSVSRRKIAACPLAFGEVGVRERIRSVLRYRKPALWIVIASILVCAVMGGCFLTDPESGTEDPANAGQVNAEQVNAEQANTDQVSTDAADRNQADVLTLNRVVELSKKGEELSWADFEPYEYTDIGSGLYIWRFEINPVFSLAVGGGSTSRSPEYIDLVCNETGDYIDIREEDVYGFISQYREKLREAAVSTAILSQCGNRESEERIFVESHAVLDTDSHGTADHKDQSFERTETVYLLALWQAYSVLGGQLTLEEGSYLPIGEYPKVCVNLQTDVR